jgi:hypothetical protein
MDKPRTCHTDLTGETKGNNFISTLFHSILPTIRSNTKIVVNTNKETSMFLALFCVLSADSLLELNVSVVKKGVTAASYALVNAPPNIIYL